MDLGLIDTIVVVLFENRSFDHMLGYLALPPYNRKIDGISTDQGWVTRTMNVHDGIRYPIWHMTAGSRAGELLAGDPPHERDDTRVQLGAAYPFPPQGAPMNGFVDNYASVPKLEPAFYNQAVGYYTAAEVPITHFLAENYAVCDNWYSCIPTSTWPNRLMAMAGFTMTDNTIGDAIPDQMLVYDWLLNNNISWRVYHEGWPIFTLMHRMRLQILRDAVMQKRFRWFNRFAQDFASKDPFPKVVFIEPKYTPDFFSLGMNSDDHAPSSVAGGQIFLRDIYSALIQNPTRWQKTVMIVTYDENGGFFDHKSPLAIHTDPHTGANWIRPFFTTGVRVPALIVSPLVEPKAVFSEPLDHTCILKFIGAKFGGGRGYSSEVDNRSTIDGHPLSDIAKTLTRKAPRPERLAPPVYPEKALTRDQVTVVRAQTTAAVDMNSHFARAFAAAAKDMRENHAKEARIKFPQSRDRFV
ncbi:MAG: alkaline phosphatase family protein [Candidatus Binataceae bacterium]